MVMPQCGYRLGRMCEKRARVQRRNKLASASAGRWPVSTWWVSVCTSGPTLKPAPRMATGTTLLRTDRVSSPSTRRLP